MMLDVVEAEEIIIDGESQVEGGSKKEMKRKERRERATPRYHHHNHLHQDKRRSPWYGPSRLPSPHAPRHTGSFGTTLS